MGRDRSSLSPNLFLVEGEVAMNLRAPRSDGPSPPLNISPHDDSCEPFAIIRGNAIDALKNLQTKVDCVITSPAHYMQERTQPADHINLGTRSVCDKISFGMTKDGISWLAQDRKLRLGEKERQSNSWVFEEPNFCCTILFGEAGTVVKNKKTFISD